MPPVTVHIQDAVIQRLQAFDELLEGTLQMEAPNFELQLESVCSKSTPASGVNMCRMQINCCNVLIALACLQIVAASSGMC